MKKPGQHRKATNKAKKAFKDAVTSYVKDLRDTLRDLVNVRVRRVGGQVIRSREGEPPRREYGDLYKSFKYRVTERGDRVEGKAYSDSFVSKLHEPKRPHWKPALKKVGDPTREIKRRFKQNMKRR